MRTFLNSFLICCKCFAAFAWAQPVSAQTLDWHGLLDLRALATSSEATSERAGFDKQRFDHEGQALRVGQAILVGDVEFGSTLGARLAVGADDRRAHVLDLNEAFMSWTPIPVSAWHWRFKAGAFFVPGNLETDYDTEAWTPRRTLSMSAINAWSGAELRAKGLEVDVTHRGRPSGSAWDVGAVLGTYYGNSPAGTLLTWRGWTVDDRITGLSETIPIANLPAFAANAPLRYQTSQIHVFRDIDGRIGYYAGIHANHARDLHMYAMHYDNRANPLSFKEGQYSWLTQFDQLGASGAIGAWEVLAQYMRGSTFMGRHKVGIDFNAWYLLVSRSGTHGRWTLRYDKFWNVENDTLPDDPVSEYGGAWTLAYLKPLSEKSELVVEWQLLLSDRDARELFGKNGDSTERSLTLAWRYHF